MLFRSNAVVGLDADEAHALGIRTGVDLREPGERDAEPGTLGPDAVLHHHALLDLASGAPEPTSLEQITHWIIEARGTGLAAVAGLLAHAELPAVVFCSAGKDRTGMLCGLVQSALGVARETVVADYAESARLMPQSFRELAHVRSRLVGYTGRLSPDHFDSPPGLIAAVLDGIDARHGGAAGYLQDHGLPAADLDLLRRRLIAPAKAG